VSAVVTGDVMCNGTLYNGGALQGTATAAADIHNHNSAGFGVGTFGPTAKSLSAALDDKTAVRFADPASFPQGEAAIDAASTGAQGVYRITSGASPATLVFLEDGTVRINGGSPVPLPANGLIYVEERDVKVQGVVEGRVTVVTGGTWTLGWHTGQDGVYHKALYRAGGSIRINGDLTYHDAPVETPDGTFPTTPDALGLLANQNVILDNSYYESLASRTDKREMRVDAAAMAVNGWIGIDVAAAFHLTSGEAAARPPYTLIWRGARIFASFANAPENTSYSYDHHGNLVKMTQGFEVKQSKYDFGLKNYKCPPGFPYTRQATMGAVPGKPGRLEQLIEDADAALLTTLRELATSSLTLVQSGSNWAGDTRAYYHCQLNGKDYYRGQYTVPGTEGTEGTDPTYTATYNASGLLYRVAWREAIGTPLQPQD
jgi:hypothetical protein